jgi:hypothetical protein
MVGKLFLSVLLLLVGVYPATTNTQSHENASIEREEYAVYSATLSGIYPKPGATSLVVSNPAGTRRGLAGLKEKNSYFEIRGGPRISQDTFEDLLQRDTSNRWLERRFDVKTDYALVDFREIKRLFNDFAMSNDLSKEFKEKYPGAFGFISLSRVGFNARMDEAAVFASWTCGHSLCGEGEFILLSKQGGVWRIVNRAMLYIS